VNSKNRLQSLFRGWFPQDPFRVRSAESGKGKSTTTAYAVGYGVGLGIGESFIVIVDLAGWTAIESSLSPPFDILSGMFVSFLGTMLALAIGAKLSRKLKERWIR
jgi:hypothetical protein